MTDITEARENIQIEDVKFKSAVSEAVASILGGSINFINKRQYDCHNWNLNGDFSLVQLSEVGDGVFICQENMEIVGYALYIGTNGNSGNTTVDIHSISSDGTDNGSIFTTKPSIDDTASDGSFTHSNVRDSDNEVPTGHTLVVFNNLNFNRHDGLRLDLDSASGGASDLQLTIFFRPR